MRSFRATLNIPLDFEEAVKHRLRELDYSNVSQYVLMLICSDLSGSEFRNEEYHDLPARPVWYQDRVYAAIAAKFFKDRQKKSRKVRRITLPPCLEAERSESPAMKEAA